MKQIGYIFLISLLLIFLAPLAFGQQNNEAKKLFNLGERAYQEKRYKDAIYYFAQSISLCGNDYECYALNYNGLGASYEEMRDDSRALFYYEKAIDAARKLGNKEEVAANLFLAGSIYYRKAIDFEKAYRYLEESKGLFNELNDKDSLPIVFHNLGKAALAIGEFDEALSSFINSAELYKEKGDEYSVGANLSQIGLTYSKMGQPEKALSYFEEALYIAKKHNDPEAMSIIMRDIADTYADLYKPEESISYYQKSIEIQRENNLLKELGTTLNNLGTLYFDLGLYEKALSNYEQALKLSNEEKDTPSIAITLNNLGHAYAKLGSSDMAFFYYQQSLELERKLKRPQYLFYVLNNIGMEYFRVRKYDDALKYLYETLEINRKINNPYMLSISLSNIGTVYLKQGKLKEAENIFLEGRKLEPKIKPNKPFHPGLIEIYLLTDRYDDALRLINEIPPLWKDSISTHIQYHTQLGLIYKGKGDLIKSLDNFLQAVYLTEEMRYSVTERGAFFGGGGYYSRLKPYRELISVLAEMDEKGYSFRDSSIITSKFTHKSPVDSSRFYAFYFSELTKARTLLEAMAGYARKTTSEEIPHDLKSREDELLSQLNYLDRQWESALKKGEKAVKNLQSKREAVKGNLESLITEFRKNYPRYAALHYPLPVNAEELPLKEKEVLLEYAITDDATYLFVVRKGGVKRLIKIPLTRQSVEETVKSFIEPMNTRRPKQFSTKLASRLYRALLSDALNEIKEDERIIIVPDGILGLLPFEALIIKEGRDFNDSTYVADRYTITYYQSATIMALQRILKKTEPEKPLFALGNPVFTRDDPRYIAWKQGMEKEITNLKQYAFRGLAIKAKWGAVTQEEPDKIEFLPLPETEVEVKEIAKIMGIKSEPPQVLLSVMANETNLNNAGLEKYRYIHFATHSSLPGMIQGVNEPFILLSQVENHGDDGFLKLSEVASMKLNADLVVLSACVTGVGKEKGF